VLACMFGKESVGGEGLESNQDWPFNKKLNQYFFLGLFFHINIDLLFKFLLWARVSLL